MARKQERKQQKKRKKEQHNAAKRTERAERSRYPRIVFRRDGESPSFMTEIERIVAEFDFESESCCDEYYRSMYRAYRKVGIDGFEFYARTAEGDERRRELGQTKTDFRASILMPVLNHLGDWIFERLPENYRKNPLPFYYYDVSPTNRRLEITFEFLPRTKSPTGTIYSSPLEPKICIGDESFTVGFFRHPLEQACQRMAPSLPMTYFAFQRCVEYFRHCVYYEPVVLLDGELGMRLFAPCSDQTLVQTYVKDVAGLDPPEADISKLHFVVGYCPLMQVQQHMVAKTFLLPGYRNTPEAALFNSAQVAKRERDRMRALTDNLTFEQILRGDGIEPIKFFHQNGIPQVVELEHSVFAIPQG